VIPPIVPIPPPVVPPVVPPIVVKEPQTIVLVEAPIGSERSGTPPESGNPNNPDPSVDPIGNSGSETPKPGGVLPNPSPVFVASRQFTVNTRWGEVILVDSDRQELQRVTPWPGYTGEIRTTEADFSGDGTPDIVAATGPGVRNQVVIIDGQSGQLLTTLLPFEASFTGGVFVVAGDITGDGRPDLVITPDVGGGPRVRIFDGAANYRPIADFFGIDDPNFRGGARAAIGDLNQDGQGDLFVAAGFGGGPRVALFSGQSITDGSPQRLIADFLVFEPTVRNGVYLTVGDITGDGRPDLAVGGGPSSGPRVSIFSGAELLQNRFSRFADFFVGSPSNRGGVRLAIKDIDGDRQADLVATLGEDSSGQILGYQGRNITNGILLPRVLAVVPTLDGVFVG
jgi:hypothetical protein